MTFLLVGCISMTRGSGNLKTEMRPVSGFRSVEMAMTGKLIIDQSGKESLSIEAEDNLLQYITTEVKGDLLVIGTKPFTGFRSTRPVIIRLGVKDLDSIALSGSGEIESGAIRSDRLAVDISGSGSMTLAEISTPNFRLKENGSGSFKSRQVDSDEIELVQSGSGAISIDNLEAENIQVQADSSGSIELSGRVNKQDLKIAGSGSYSAGNLKSSEVSIAVSGSGSVDLNVDKLLIANVSGSGSIVYSGEAVLRKTITGSGTVTGK